MTNQGNDSCISRAAKNFISGGDISTLAEKLQRQEQLRRSQSKRRNDGSWRWSWATASAVLARTNNVRPFKFPSLALWMREEQKVPCVVSVIRLFTLLYRAFSQVGFENTFLNGTATGWGVKQAGNRFSVVIIKGDASEPVCITMKGQKRRILIKQTDDMQL